MLIFGVFRSNQQSSRKISWVTLRDQLERCSPHLFFDWTQSRDLDFVSFFTELKALVEVERLFFSAISMVAWVNAEAHKG